MTGLGRFAGLHHIVFVCEDVYIPCILLLLLLLQSLLLVKILLQLFARVAVSIVVAVVQQQRATLGQLIEHLPAQQPRWSEQLNFSLDPLADRCKALHTSSVFHARLSHSSDRTAGLLPGHFESAAWQQQLKQRRKHGCGHGRTCALQAR